MLINLVSKQDNLPGDERIWDGLAAAGIGMARDDLQLLLEIGGRGRRVQAQRWGQNLIIWGHWWNNVSQALNFNNLTNHQ